MAREWGLEVVDLNGNGRGFADAGGVAVTVRLSDYASSKGWLRTLDPLAAELIPSARALKVYVDGTLRHHAQFTQPIGYGVSVVNYQTADPWYFLKGRMIQPNGGHAPSYQDEDALALVWDLISKQEARQPTHLSKGTLAASLLMTTALQSYQDVYTEGQTIAQMQGGPFFRVDPVDGVAGTLGEFNGGPTAGEVRETVRFEFGDETLGNLTDTFQVQYNIPATAIRATGGQDANGNTLSSYAEADASVIDEYGLFEKAMAFGDVTDQATLDALAAANVQTSPPAVYTVETLWTSDKDGDPLVPKLWDDFNVGDTVGLRIRYGALDVDAQVRVNACDVVLDDDSRQERLQNLVLQEVA